MRYEKIDPQLFIENRKKLVQHLKPNALVILHSNDIMPKNADGSMPFWQNSDLFYLSGIDQSETILLLYPDAKEEVHREILFLTETNAKIAVWEGKRYTKEQARETAGMETIEWLDAFPSLLNRLMAQAEYVYLNTNEHYRAVVNVQTCDARFISWCKEKYPLHTYQRLAPIMQYLRAVKSEIEIDLIRKACITVEKGIRKALPLVKPGMREYEIEATLVSELIRNRSRGFSFNPIVAAGANSCVLHYEANDQVCKAGDTILLDIGAEYAHYCADVTRVIPVNGRFTPRQKEVYKAVVWVMQEAKKLLVPGNTLPSYQEAVGRLMEEALLNLGLLKKEDLQHGNDTKKAYKRYFMHNAFHHIGLDVHDVGDSYRPLVPGMVLTVEPGIYIQEEGLGIRLENMVVIQEHGVEDLTASIPIAPDTIEALMSAS